MIRKESGCNHSQQGDDESASQLYCVYYKKNLFQGGHQLNKTCSFKSTVHRMRISRSLNKRDSENTLNIVLFRHKVRERIQKYRKGSQC